MTYLVCKSCGQKGGNYNGVFHDPVSPYNETLGCPNPKCNGNQEVITQEEFDNRSKNIDDICAKCNKPRFAHKGKLGVVNHMGGPPLCAKFVEPE